jgi:hypothetical protein
VRTAGVDATTCPPTVEDQTARILAAENSEEEGRSDT